MLTGLPLFFAAGMRFINPDNFALMTHGAGLVMSAVGGVMLVLGTLSFRAICRLDY